MENLFSNLSSQSRVWVYQSSRAFNAQEATEIAAMLQQFVAQWNSHKIDVVGGGELLHNLFVVLAADESQVGVSGCSIDSTVRFVRELGAKFGVDFFNRWNMAYEQNNEVKCCSYTEFDALLNAGVVSPSTTVFNPLVKTIEELQTQFRISFAQSPYKNLAAVSKVEGLTL
ncbi:MAG: hypothetical protein JNK66_00375 [Chitinophagales bacterium]|nr:hypothetical protein [Chitinophagales bacterium]